MPDLIPIKKSHISYYNNYPLYYLSKDGEALLYKKPEQQLDQSMLDRSQYPQFYILKEDEAKVVKKLQKVLNMKLVKDLASKGIDAVRKTLCTIVDEALSGPIDASLPTLPETIEILLVNAKKNTGLLESLVSINDKSSKIVDHSINVMSITAQYCFFKEFDDEETKKMSLCALLHDIGLIEIEQELVETPERLTDEEFKKYKTHPKNGFDVLKSHIALDESIKRTALEHHERLDGSGYAKGITDISFEARVVGLIDSYEALKYQDKSFRKSLKPFAALGIIKEDVVKGKYDKTVFIDLCSCLIK